jgi:hypothetical protein
MDRHRTFRRVLRRLERGARLIRLAGRIPLSLVGEGFQPRFCEASRKAGRVRGGFFRDAAFAAYSSPRTCGFVCSPARGEREPVARSRHVQSLRRPETRRHVKEHLVTHPSRRELRSLLRMRMSPQRTSSEGGGAPKSADLWFRIRCRIRRAPLGAPHALILMRYWPSAYLSACAALKVREAR